MMTPRSLHMIAYKGKFMGSGNKVISFINPSHAKFVRSFMKYENSSVKQIDGNTYSFEHPKTHIMKPIMKNHLALHTFDTNIGLYFAKVNNVDIVLVDNLKQVNSACVNMISNYKIDSEIDESFQRYQMERLYAKNENEMIDYKEEYEQMLYVEMLINQDDYE